MKAVSATRRIILVAALILPFGTAIAAETYPARTIKLIVPFPPGGPIDVMARFIAQRLVPSLGQMVIENRPGAGGTIGTKAAAAMPPDGYSLLVASSTTLASGPSLYKNIGYDPLTSFTPIALVSSVPFALVVAPRLPIGNVADLLAYAKAHPGKLNFGAPVGTLPHLTGEWFKITTGADIMTIPYKGAASTITDMLTGQIDLTFEPISVLLAHIHDNKVRPIAITSATRSAELPDVPTLVESGLPGFVAVSWTGIVAPAGVPPDIVAKLNALILDNLGSAEARASLAKLGAEARTGTPQAFASFIADEAQRWAGIVKSAGVKLD